MYILGISAFYHDSAAALLKDGRIVCALEEERFSRVKHDNAFPEHAIRHCLNQEGIAAGDLAAVAYYEKPLLKFERILDTFVQTYPFSFRPFVRGMPEWLARKIKVGSVIRNTMGYEGSILYLPHHRSHAASAFYPSPFEEAAVLTVDGVGEYQTTGLWYGKGTELRALKELRFPDSLGLLYSTFTAFLGFRVNEDEYKVMGLAAYGKPRYGDAIRQVVAIRGDGSFRMDMRFFRYREGFQMWSKRFEELFGAPRLAAEPVTERHADLAASIQHVTEEIYCKMLGYLHELTGSRNVCIAGGVGLNALANGKLYEQTPFQRAYVFGAAGDSGGAVGSALYAHHRLFGHAERQSVADLRLGSFYGQEYIEKLLRASGLPYERAEDSDELAATAARLLADGNVIGWFQGRMEFGPRALGARSILASPRPASMKEQVNEIKIREQFRPFAGSILQEYVHEYFVVPEERHASPFMIFCFPVRPERRDEIAAIVHEDGTCRIQTVPDGNGRYSRLIRAFYERTGIPCILNTSFNLKGEPIVERPEQAIEDFLRADMQYLVLGNCIVSRPQQPLASRGPIG